MFAQIFYHFFELTCGESPLFFYRIMVVDKEKEEEEMVKKGRIGGGWGEGVVRLGLVGWYLVMVVDGMNTCKAYKGGGFNN